MEENLTQVLWITVIGMGLVFAVIILLSVFLSLLVRLTGKSEKAEESPIAPVTDEMKIRAAVAAVAVLRAREATLAPMRFPMPPTALVSAWQAVLRSNILNKRGSIR
jgi:Na+-transporting methylmalonyl-CoA/oxaloacetate decarboxylase gamma subunit